MLKAPTSSGIFLTAALSERFLTVLIKLSLEIRTGRAETVPPVPDKIRH
jgi:hypothetical protein